MKRAISLILALIMCLSLCACGENGNAGSETEVQSKTPTIESIVDGIKNEFKDPESVQLSDAHIARVKNGDEESETEFYVIGTIRAKNSFGGYGEPQAYIIHCESGNYEIVGEYNDASYAMQKTFNELGCGASWGLD